MTVIMGTANVPGNATVAAFVVPAGIANGVMFQPTPNPQSVYIGPGPGVSATNGMAVSVTPGNAENYNSSKGVTIYATTGNATASSFCYLLSTGN
jgi:hypothetical protein